MGVPVRSVHLAADAVQRLRPPRLGALVRAYLGLPGAGKTYAMTAHALAARARHPELRVYSNYPVYMPVGEAVLPLESVQQFEEAENGLVLLDEAHALLGSRDWTGKDRNRVLVKLGQMRKAGLYLWYTTHSAGKVDKQLRLLTEEAYDMRAWLKLLRGFVYRRRAGVEPQAEALSWGYLRFRQSVGDSYDTLGAVGTSGLSEPAGSEPGVARQGGSLGLDAAGMAATLPGSAGPDMAPATPALGVRS